jgi:hypothetical protein
MNPIIDLVIGSLGIVVALQLIPAMDALARDRFRAFVHPRTAESMARDRESGESREPGRVE